MISYQFGRGSESAPRAGMASVAWPKIEKFFPAGGFGGAAAPPDTIPGSASRAGGARGFFPKLHDAQNQPVKCHNSKFLIGFNRPLLT